jgi:hypothetical protein
VHEQHGQTLALDGVFDVSELLCAHHVAFAQQPLPIGLHVCLEAWIGKRHENNQPNHHNNGQKHRITKACPDHTGAPFPSRLNSFVALSGPLLFTNPYGTGAEQRCLDQYGAFLGYIA